jgi:hypothetical protein
MKVNFETKGYKVVVVGNNEGRYTIETYDSVSRQWSQATPSWSHVLGRAYEWKNFDCNRTRFHWQRARICAFDLVRQQPEHFSFENYEFNGVRMMRYAIAEDRMFALLVKGSTDQVIIEFQSPSTANVWVSVKTHGRCT